MSGDEQGAASGPAAIIITKKKKGHSVPHGGAWKVAYADFVTAMMAFFLLLWLLNVTTAEQKSSIADYFAPVSIAQTTEGSGGPMSGKSMLAPGSHTSDSSPTVPLIQEAGLPGLAATASEDVTDEEPEFQKQPNSPKPGEQESPDLKQAMDKLAGAVDKFSKDMEMLRDTYPEPRPDENRHMFQERLDQAAKRLGEPGQIPGETLSNFARRLDEVARAEAAEQLAIAAGGVAQAAAGSAGAGAGGTGGAGGGGGGGGGGGAGGSGQGGAGGKGDDEDRRFLQLSNEIQQSIAANPELKDATESLMIDVVPEGLRIQLADQDKLPMFASGGTDMGDQARAVLNQVASKIRNLPHRITVTGHTDSTPFRPGSVRDNWDLSAERAAATMRQLSAGGVPGARFENIIGRADRDPMVAGRPDASVNRRVSIILHRQDKASGG